MIGAFVGWLFFDAGVPGMWTWIGGPILVLGIVMVVKGGAEVGLADDDE